MLALADESRLRDFDEKRAMEFAERITVLDLRSTFICADGCLREDGKPKGWQTMREADKHQQKFAHRVQLNPNLRVAEIPIEVQRALLNDGHGELDIAKRPQ